MTATKPINHGSRRRRSVVPQGGGEVGLKGIPGGQRFPSDFWLESANRLG